MDKTLKLNNKNLLKYHYGILNKYLFCCILWEHDFVMSCDNTQERSKYRLSGDKEETVNHIKGGARGVMVIVVGNGHGDTSSNLDETDCISHSINTFRKGMNPIILPPAMGKLGSSALVRQLV